MERIPKYDQAHASYEVPTLLFVKWQKTLNLKGDFMEAKEGIRRTAKAILILPHILFLEREALGPQKLWLLG